MAVAHAYYGSRSVHSIKCKTQRTETSYSKANNFFLNVQEMVCWKKERERKATFEMLQFGNDGLFNMHIKYIEKLQCIKFIWNIVANNKNRPLVCTTAIRYIGQIWLLPKYFQRAAIWCMCAKFHQVSSRIERLICVATERRADGQRDRRIEELMDKRKNGQIRLCKLFLRYFLGTSGDIKLLLNTLK